MPRSFLGRPRPLAGGFSAVGVLGSALRRRPLAAGFPGLTRGELTTASLPRRPPAPRRPVDVSPAGGRPATLVSPAAPAPAARRAILSAGWPSVAAAAVAAAAGGWPRRLVAGRSGGGGTSVSRSRRTRGLRRRVSLFSRSYIVSDISRRSCGVDPPSEWSWPTALLAAETDGDTGGVCLAAAAAGRRPRGAPLPRAATSSRGGGGVGGSAGASVAAVEVAGCLFAGAARFLVCLLAGAGFSPGCGCCFCGSSTGCGCCFCGIAADRLVFSG